MKPWTKKYFDYFNIAYNESGWHDHISCEYCGAVAIDIHHISGRGSNDIENLIALCRQCHTDAHAGKIKKINLIVIHLKNMKK